MAYSKEKKISECISPYEETLVSRTLASKRWSINQPPLKCFDRLLQNKSFNRRETSEPPAFLLKLESFPFFTADEFHHFSAKRRKYQ